MTTSVQSVSTGLSAEGTTPLRVYVDCVGWFVRPQNTDWRYSIFQIPRLPEYAKGIETHAQQSWAISFKENERYIRRKIAQLILGNRKPDPLRYQGELDRAELQRSGCDVVFSHRRFPINAAPIPVVWQNALLDPEMRLANGATEEELKQDLEAIAPMMEKASLVQLATSSEARRHVQMFPEFASKFVAVSFFLPGTQSLSAEAVREKQEAAGKIEIVFVGNDARRKGLDRLLAAYMQLPQSLRGRTKLSIVTNFNDGQIPIPSDASIRMSQPLPRAEVMRLFSSAHIFAMPSRFECFGLVFVEAMANGMVPIVPNWEVQREIVDSGTAGCTTTGEPADLAQLLAALIEDSSMRTNLALAAHQRYEKEFSPDVVAERSHSIFLKARLPS